MLLKKTAIRLNINPPVRRYKWPGRELEQALAPLAGRVAQRYWLESARLALLWGLAATLAGLVLLRLYPAVSPVAVAAIGGVAVLAVLALRVFYRPDAMAVVRVADELELSGDAVTSFRLLESGAADPWSGAAVDRGVEACARLAREKQPGYSLVPYRRPWRDVALLAAALVVLQFVPDPMGSYWAERRAERQALRAAAAEAQQAVDLVRDLQVNGEAVLPEEVRQKLADLPREVARAGDRGQAAAMLERAGWELDGARAVVDPSANRDIQRLAEAWGGREEAEWSAMVDALQSGEREEIDRAVEGLADKLQAGAAEDKIDTAAALLAAASMVENPGLRRALREIAAAGLNNNSSGGQSGGGNSPGGGAQNLAAAADSLAGALAGAAASASAGGALGNASATMAALARKLTGDGSGAGGTQLAGNSVGSTGSGGNASGTTGTTPGGNTGGHSHGPGET